MEAAPSPAIYPSRHEDTTTHQSLAPQAEHDLPPGSSRAATPGHFDWILNAQVSYGACLAVFFVVVLGAVLTPLKEYYLGSYVTKPFDEVRNELVARKLHHLGVVTSGVHYFDTFDRELVPLIDRDSKMRLTRAQAAPLGLTDFLVHANVRRDDLLTHLPAELLGRPVNLMDDVYGPICSPSPETTPQLLFGNWFPAIHHEFCRQFQSQFPRSRFFNVDGAAPADPAIPTSLGRVSLGLIAVVNMSEVYLRHFDDALVVRKIMKQVQEGYLDLAMPDYTDAVADAIVQRYASGIPLAQLIALLPRSIDDDHVALVDVLGVSHLREHYLTSQRLTMGVNVNGEAAILAEVTHAAASYFSADFLVNSVGMHLVSTMHLAPFWYCAVQHTSMDKTLTPPDIDAAVIRQCGRDCASRLPLFAVNLMFLFQKNERDYAKMDNTTTFTLGRYRELDPDYVALDIPETLTESALLAMDGSAWTKLRVVEPLASAALPATTPYGYLYTPDCQATVAAVLVQTGRNVQKYQAYLGDGLGNCAFRDSQETAPQSLCRLFLGASELIFKALDGTVVPIPRCDALVALGPDDATRMRLQENLRQVEWFMIDTEMLPRRIRIQDNTSRQIRTFLLILNLIGATYYALEYLSILQSVWVFVRNSVYRRCPALNPSTSGSAAKYTALPPSSVGLRLSELLQCDPAVGALQHPGTMVLMYLGAVGALSNIFSLGCTAQLSIAQGGVVIFCRPSIPASSIGLMVMTLSSSYWVIRVTLQTRSFAVRLTQALRDDFVRFWGMNAVAVLAIHFACKLGADFLFANVELRSDPHLYAIFGGLVVSWMVAAVFLLVQLVAADGATKIRKMLTRRRTANGARRASHARAAKDRVFLSKWSTSKLDTVLHNCASPQIAQQLESLNRKQTLQRSKSGRLVASMTDTRKSELATGSDILFHEYVVVHCAAGSHGHLEAVVWEFQADGRSGCRSLFEVPNSGVPQVVPVKSGGN